MVSDFWQLASPWARVLLLLAVLSVVAWLTLRAHHRLDTRRRRRRAHGAATAEKDAVALLQSHGYRVLQTQVEQLWQVRRGTDTIQVRLRADARVSRNGRQFIAEVKSGSLSANVRHGPTRRQLLEYAVAYRTS